MFDYVQNGTRQSDAVQVEAASGYTDVPDSLHGITAEHDQADVDCVLDKRENDNGPNGKPKPAGWEDAGVKR